MTRRIELNADMGEYGGDPEQAAIEDALMGLVAACSIACGGHTGDEETMRRTLRAASARGLVIGAHPSYPDKEHFGRRSIRIDPDDLRRSLEDQTHALRRLADAEGGAVIRVKAHGALYNDAARDPSLARILAAAAHGIALVGPPESAIERAAAEAGLAFIAEGFVDRRYRASGALVPRGEPGAVIEDIDARAAQAAALASGEAIATEDGALRIAVDTLCIHSDAPRAVETARAVRDALRARNIDVRAFAP